MRRFGARPPLRAICGTALSVVAMVALGLFPAAAVAAGPGSGPDVGLSSLERSAARCAAAQEHGGAGLPGAMPVGSPVEKILADAIDQVVDHVPIDTVPVDDMPDPLPFGGGPCPGVRPGALVRFNPVETGGCTMNFAVLGRDPKNNLTHFIGTAGHCVLSSEGEQAWGPGYGPVAWDARNNVIGRVAYAVRRSTMDFALIRLDPGVNLNPQMCYFGGPTAINYDQNNSLTELQYYGQGTMLAAYSPARTAYAQTMKDPNEVFAYGLTVFGDSGAPVHSRDGRAVGLAVTIGGQLSGPTNTGVIGITRLGPQLARAQQWVGLSLSLLTAAKLDVVSSAVDSAKSLPHATPNPWRPIGPVDPESIGIGGGGSGRPGGGG